jgi:hypothetical protein
MAGYSQYKADGIDGVNGDGASEEQLSIEAQLRATANMISAHVWYATPSGALVFVNSRSADYLGLPQDHPLRFGIDVGGEWGNRIIFADSRSPIPLVSPRSRATYGRTVSKKSETKQGIGPRRLRE